MVVELPRLYAEHEGVPFLGGEVHDVVAGLSPDGNTVVTDRGDLDAVSETAE